MIEIKINAGSAAEARREMIGLLGENYRIDTGWQPPSGELRIDVNALAEQAEALSGADLGAAEAVADEGPNYAAMKAAHDAEQATPKRERGKPSPGRARRTKEEIAEDEADAAAPLTVASFTALPDDATSEEVAAAFAGLKASISTGEARVDPANPEPEDSAEDQAQDAIDEAEEVEAARDPVKPLTNDDLKAEMTAYVQRFGIPAVQEDGTKIFRAGLGEPPAGETAWRLSLVGDDQERLVKAVAAWKAALAENPFKRASVAK